MTDEKIDPNSLEGEKILSDALGEDNSPGNTDPIKVTEHMSKGMEQAKEWIDARQIKLLEYYGQIFADHVRETPIDNPALLEGADAINLTNLIAEVAKKLVMDLKPMKKIAREVADLENDFRYVQEISTFTSKRYQQVWDVLPSLQEMDAMIASVEAHDENDKDFFAIGEKEDRLKKLRSLREARRIDLGG